MPGQRATSADDEGRAREDGPARRDAEGVPDYFFLEEDFLEEDFLRGTLPPARRASESPMAIACFRLVTFLPERPLFNVPRLRSCIAFSTFCDAFFPYRAIVRPPVLTLAGTMPVERERSAQSITVLSWYPAAPEGWGGAGSATCKAPLPS